MCMYMYIVMNMLISSYAHVMNVLTYRTQSEDCQNIRNQMNHLTTNRDSLHSSNTKIILEFIKAAIRNLFSTEALVL
jgi:hypothetical protein